MTNPNNPVEAILRSRLELSKDARQAVLALVGNVRDEWAAIERDGYLSRGERDRERERVKREAEARLPSLLEAAEQQCAELREAAIAEVERQKSSERAEALLGRLLAANGGDVAAVVDRAVETNDPELLAAARVEARFEPVGDGVHGVQRIARAHAQREGRAKGTRNPLEEKATEALAAALPGTERDVVLEALRFTESPGIEAAAKFAHRALAGDETAAIARLEFGYETSGATNGGESS